MRSVLIWIFILHTGVLCQYTFPGQIRLLAVGNRKVFFTTDSQLHQMRHDLTEETVINISNSTHRNTLTVMLPFEKNRTLITCGTSDCGYCEVLDIDNITHSIYREPALSVAPNEGESAVSFLVDYTSDKSSGTYILMAREYTPIEKSNCVSSTGVTWLNTLHSQKGDIFSTSGYAAVDAKIKEVDVQWVDGFQTSSESYIFANKMSMGENKVIFLKMDNMEKSEMYRSVKAATLRCCKDRHRQTLVSSTHISNDSSLLWMGIFSELQPHKPDNTALAVYNIAKIRPKCFPSCDEKDSYKSEEAYEDHVVYKHNSMTSVAAKRKGTWTTLYIGTANGQLIKLVLDADFRSGCAKVLYKSDDDRPVFPRLYFDPVDHNYIYIALMNQIRRISVSQCNIYNTLRACTGSMDPFCGWCLVTNRCCMQEECQTSPWISIAKDSLQKELMSFQVASMIQGKISLNLHLCLEATGNLNFTCTLKVGSMDLCDSQVAHFPVCSCNMSENLLPSDGLKVTVAASISNQTITDSLTLRSCPNITENMRADVQCLMCVSAGCYWISSQRVCTWTPVSALYVQNQDACSESYSESYTPEVLSLWPNEVSFLGKNYAEIKGTNLDLVVKIRFQDLMNCTLQETPVLERLNGTLKFHIPSGNKETVTVCLVTADGRCHSNATLTYSSLPTCTELQPGVTWSSGERKIKVLGSNLQFVDKVNILESSKELCQSSDSKNFMFHSHNQRDLRDAGPFNVSLMVMNTGVVCAHEFSYHPDPEFTSFTTSKVVSDMLVNIQKKEDKLNLTFEDLKVWGLQDKNQFECKIEEIKSSVVICKISGDKDVQITVDSVRIGFGSVTKILQMTPGTKNYLYTLVVLIILILLGAVAGVFIHRKSKQQMNAKMNERLEMLENEIRHEIRQGFVDLQTETSDLYENVGGAIPYLDYKHFAMKIFFPEGGPLANQMIKEIGQDAVMDEKCQAFSALIRDKTFLTCFVHALEEQNSFSLKDKCTVASLLTVTLHGDLPYLTQLMEELLQSLMDQPGNAQPKLLLRRTQSVVEKLLTNWMSICLYGFLRNSVGQPLFLMVSALNQQISKGPVDAVTGKALYTLNEDWLLWQAQGFDFSMLKLKVLFAVGTEGLLSEPLLVEVLTCDTIDQVKDKILQTFLHKFSFQYTQQLRDIGIEYMKDGSYVPLEEIDGSSEVQGDVTMLNTMKHYEIQDGASIKVINKKVHAPLSPQTSVKDDQNFTTKYFHLIDPDIDTDQSEHPERKKLKLKEIYLTKLLSTKVAVHSYVEMLFHSIWGMPNNRAPTAVKYFFDFLDSQAENKKIMDPDVIHIWKTNSLPLRFWVNILKNPNFVFSDLEKTPHLDGCLSVIAQAFMDSFSLTDHKLGKHAPTNKLLYAKDIPQYKQEVKTYYKLVRDQPSVSSEEFKVFLEEESKKHVNEFNESAALRELYKYMKRYFNEIEQHLEQKGASCELKEKMHQVQEHFESVKRSAWK